MKKTRAFAVVLLAVIVASWSNQAAFAQDAGQEVVQKAVASVFDGPQRMLQWQQLLAYANELVQRQQLEEAQDALRRAAELQPLHAQGLYALARVQAARGRIQDALSTIERFVNLGPSDIMQMQQDTVMQAVVATPEFLNMAQLVARRAAGEEPMPTPQGLKAAPVTDRSAIIAEENTLWDPNMAVFRVFHEFPPQDVQHQIVNGYDEEGALIREWHQAGTAAGLYGVLYDNRDRGHSNMDFRNFPQLTRIRYSQEASERGFDYGLHGFFFHNFTVIGNASLAMTGNLSRSMTRLAMTDPRTITLHYLHYVSNHLYVFPEHRDYKTGSGDLFPANTAYVITSRGSSGSDRPFLSALALTIAAFQPETMQRLRMTGMLMPTIQFIFRMSNAKVAGREDYLSGKAHPTAFSANQINRMRMIKMAQSMKADEIPAMVQMRVVEETKPELGIQVFDFDNRERLFDTPAAIARVFRTTQNSRRMVVDASASRDINGRKITFHWVILQGDPERIQITPKNDDASIVEITVAWHPRMPIPYDNEIHTNRVDIGLFIDNGIHLSAPGFVTHYFLNSEERVYNNRKQPETIRYRTPETGGRHTDQIIDAPKDWTDQYIYDDEGQLLGWTRTRGKETQRFTADGALVRTTDDAGRPREAITVRYIAERRDDLQMRLKQVDGNEILTYSYTSDDDRRGRIESRRPVE